MSLERRMGRRKPKPKNSQATHKLIAKVAIAIAFAAYDDLALDNEFYKVHPDAMAWATENWKQFVPLARDNLIDQLTMDSVSDHEKELISEALMLDAAHNPPIAHAQAEAARLSLH